MRPLSEVPPHGCAQHQTSTMPIRSREHRCLAVNDLQNAHVQLEPVWGRSVWHACRLQQPQGAAYEMLQFHT